MKNLCKLLVTCSLLWMGGCVEPATPEFAYQDGLLFIDAYALTEAGLSTVTIRTSVVEFGRFRTDHISGAVVYIDGPAGTDRIDFTEQEGGVYAGPSDFAVQSGESWQLHIELPDGRRYESSPESVGSAVPIRSVSSYFTNELTFDQGLQRFIPGHAVDIAWQDPPNEKNYYLWRYRTFEPLNVCLTCDGGRRNGDECIDENLSRHFSYLCDPKCWLIRYSDRLQVFDDQVTDGTEISGFPVADVPYYRPQDILIEVQQISLSESAYEYFSVVNDILEESSGLNAPPPAGLLGNLYNPEDPNDPVLGQFTVAAVTTNRLFIDRSDVDVAPITPDRPIMLDECTFDCSSELYSYPCKEGRFRTAKKPEGWPD